MKESLTRKKKVYVNMIADLLHDGHIKIINKAAELGEVIVGVLSDDACEEIHDVPFIDVKRRMGVLAQLKNVSYVVIQETPSLIANIRKYEIDAVVHGDDWQTGELSKYRTEVIDEGTEIHEFPYDKSISDANIKEAIYQNGINPTSRMNSLRRKLAKKKPLRILEVHNAISGLIAEKTSYDNVTFDGMWSSSLTDSTSKGKPDIEAVDTTARLVTINEIFEATTKPMIYDADTGGKPEHFAFTVRSLERTGVSAVIIEDKTGLKKNSLFGTDVEQTQDTIENFMHKIQVGKAAQLSESFMIIARVESLILDKGMHDALQRAFMYVKAGADGIMIHSRQKDGKEILEFLTKFRSVDKTTPIVVVPSSFKHIHINDLYEAGANIIIYANHMLRSAVKTMTETASSILKYGRTLEAEDDGLMISIKEILEYIPGTK